MCCILYCLSHPDFGLVLISNRDEYLKRPATPSQWHSFPSASTLSSEGTPSSSIAHHTTQSGPQSQPSEQQPFLSGLDAHPLGGGTWLGLTKSGRLAAITNFTEAAPPPLPQGRGLEAYRSRGSLVRDWLKGEGENSGQERVMERYLEGVASRMDEWPGFNLLVGQLHADRAEMGYVSNRSGDIKAEYFSSEKGHGSDGLSNSCLRQPWDKVKLGREKLDRALDDFDKEREEGKQRRAAEDQLSLDLFSILESKATITARQDFARSIQIPPIRLADDAWYATRTATVLLLRRDGTVRWWENDVYVLSPQGSPIRGEELHLQPRYFEWQLQSP